MKKSETLGHVMLIDDERFDRKMYQRTLQKYNIAEHVTSFAYAEEALTYLCDPANPAVDMILLDINMPRMNGFEFLDAAQERFGMDFNATVAVMLTTPLNRNDQKRAADSPMIDAFFAKPLTLDNINTAVRMVTVKRELAALRKQGLMAVSFPTTIGAGPSPAAPRDV